MNTQHKIEREIYGLDLEVKKAEIAFWEEHNRLPSLFELEKLMDNREFSVREFSAVI